MYFFPFICYNKNVLYIFIIFYKLEMESTMKLRSAIILCLLVFSLLPLYLLGSLAIYENNKLIKRTVKDNLETICTLPIANLEKFCEERQHNLYLLGQMNIIQDALLVSLDKKDAKDAPDITYVENILQERRQNAEYLTSISLVNSDFILVSSSEEHTPGKSSALKNSIENATRTDFYIGQVFRRQANGEEISIIPVYENVYYEGEVIGYLVEEIPVSYFNTFRYGLAMTEGCTMYITDKNEQLITAGTSVEGDDVVEYVTTPEERKQYSDYWNNIDFSQNPTGSFEYSIKGNNYITYYSKVKYTDWRIRINADLGFYYQATEPFRIMMYTLLSALTLCIILFIVYFAHRLTKPLRRIHSTLSEIKSNHDYSLRVNYKNRDEFGELSEQIDELLDYVEQMHQSETEQRNILAAKASHDPLTGLYNKTSMHDVLEEVLHKAKMEQMEIAVGFIDIDDFRNYNTLYGHDEGDLVLQHIAKAMHTFFSENTGRNGGDEFLFWCIKDMSDEAFKQTLSQLLQTINQGIYSERTGKMIPIYCSIGVAIKKAADTDRKQMIRTADDAMYHAKRNGKNQFFIIHE